MRARTLGGLTALAVLAADQATKLAAERHLVVGAKPVPLLGQLLSFRLQYNPGVSFSQLIPNSEAGRWLLLAMILAFTALLAFWLWRARAPLVGLGLGAIVGGALGNLCDRLVYGKVVDFLDARVFVFNLADAAINVGVALLILDWLIAATRPAPPSAGRGGES